MIRAILTADAETLAQGGLALLHERLREEAPSCADLATEFVAHLGTGAEPPLTRALGEVACEADRSGLANAFHNPAHSREVGVNWWLLSRLHGFAPPILSQETVLLGLIAAFGHDLHHDGRGNGAGDAYVPFRLEAIAAETVAEAMTHAGATLAQVAAVRAMILCTDVRSGYPQLDHPDLDDARFAPLDNPAVLLAARMLRDADLMPSAGTSIAAYHARTAELERELLFPADTIARDAAAFFDHVVAHRFLSPPGQHFVETLRALEKNVAGP